MKKKKKKTAGLEKEGIKDEIEKPLC